MHDGPCATITKISYNLSQLDLIMSQQPKLVYGQDELASVIALYESYLITDVSSNLISEKQMVQKGQMFLSWVNDLLESKLRAINQITDRSIDIFKQISSDQVEISTKILELQHECVQKNNLIENHLYTIKNIENRLVERQNDIYKLKQQNMQLTQKIEKQESKFKRQAKQFKKTFRIIQENNQSDKQIFDSIQFEYEYEKQQKDMLKDQLQALIQQKAVFIKQLDEVKRLLKASQNKLEWEVKKKLSLQDNVKQKNQMIQKLINEIEDLKDTIKSPYNGIQQDHLEQKQIQDLTYQSKSLDKNLLSQQMALRQSFFSEADLDEDFVRRNSFRKSFDEGAGNPSQNHFDQPVSSYENSADFHIKKSESLNENNHQIREKMKSNKSSFAQDQSLIKIEDKSMITNLNKNPEHSPKSILIKDMQRSPAISLEKSSKKSQSINSPHIHQFSPGITYQKQDELQIITQKVQSETQSTNEPLRRYVPDLYFAHFLLTSQAVKIKEDCQQMLNLDVKQYYQQIIEKRIPMHLWDDWVRQKMRNVVKQLKLKYQRNNKRQGLKLQG